jgi:phosphoglucosamine mutase
MMRSNNYVIGGEKSGHIIFGNLTTTGDGLLTALQLFKVVKDSNKSLAELASVVNELPQTIINIPVKDRISWQKDPSVTAAIRFAEAELDGGGRINVRASGTELLVRVMVEACDHQTLEQIAAPVAAQIRQNWGK